MEVFKVFFFFFKGFYPNLDKVNVYVFVVSG
jgi:hypothetical protein